MGDATMEELSDAGPIPARSIHDRKNQHGSDSMLIFSACSGRKSRCLIYFTVLDNSASSVISSGILMLCGQWEAQAPQRIQAAGVPLDCT